MLLDTDLPYLEPLLFHLKKDPVLQKYFTEKSYFMPKNSLVSAVKESTGKDCPSPRAIWILPQDNVAASENANCVPKMVHTFYISIIVNCIRDQFQISKGEDNIPHLGGEYLELTEIRKYVKKSVYAFAKKWAEDHITGAKFEKLTWRKDQIMYPGEDDGEKFLITALEFTVIIL